jgi:hypothetical protein
LVGGVVKTALDLLGERTKFVGTQLVSASTVEDWLELVAERAREEMRDAAEDIARRRANDGDRILAGEHRAEAEVIADRIRALLTKAQP